MDQSDWLKIGIIAKSLFPDIQPDVEMHFVKDAQPYLVERHGKELNSTCYESIRDIINFSFWYEPEWDYDLGLGYSRICNVLAICKRLKQRKLIIQYSHDTIRWFDYGSDAVKPAIKFNTIDEANECYDKLLGTHRALMPYMRIIDGNKTVLRET